MINGVITSRYREYEGPVWIYNGDTIRRKELPFSLLEQNESEGFIEVFKEEGSHWSFVDSLGKISKITEKERISDYCCTGLYGFKNLSRIIEYVASGSVARLKNELYVSGVYQNIIDDNFKAQVLDTLQKKYYITIKDRGIGMDSNSQKLIFQKFYRVQTGNIHNIKGHGLGLTYVKKIIEIHGGQIVLTSKKGFGSTFEISIPLTFNKN